MFYCYAVEVRKILKTLKALHKKAFSFRAFRFRHKFLTDLRFKNFLITKEFIRVDKKRAEKGQETVLPLTDREQYKYINPSSITLVKFEIRFLVDKSFFLVLSSMHIVVMLAADYSFFWMISMIQFLGSKEKNIKIDCE